MKHILILLSVMAISTTSFAQKKKEAPKTAPENWYHLDPSSGYPGVSVEEAYKLLKGRKSETVIVAVIDDGVDIDHEDLSGVIWKNTKEVEGNGKDDDGNGYVDDIHGWNFIGGKTEDIDQDSQESSRLSKLLETKYKNVDVTKLSADDKKQYDYCLKAKEAMENEKKELQEQLDMVSAMEGIFRGAAKGSPNVKLAAIKPFLKTYKPTTKSEKKAKTILSLQFATLPKEAQEREIPVDAAFAAGKKQLSEMINYHLNPDFDPRSIVGDDYANVSEKIYGNNRVISHNGDHGTHVSGIIAAMRNNERGMNGIADNVQIMALRVVPNGDERDKDVANAIRYAADNGAKVVNMSFGKGFSWNKKAVDDAVKYAASKDVLLVHAAGNSSKNIDVNDNFPNRLYEGGGEANNWLEIGASSWDKEKGKITAVFSNYGKARVDLFSPGVAIYSTTKDDQYDSYEGTSMASPVAAGVAAMVRSYFPKLSAAEVREILMSSAIRYNEKVRVPGKKKKVMFSELCRTGAIVNAKTAVEKAMAKK